MLKKLTQRRNALLIGGCLLLLVLATTGGWYLLRDSSLGKTPPLPPPPLLELAGDMVEVSTCQYLGSWPVADGYVKTGKAKAKGKNELKWWDTVRLSFNDDTKIFQVEPGRTLLKGSVPQLITPDTEEEALKSIQWRDNQMSVFAFRANSPAKRTVVVEIDTDNSVALYVNKRFVREMSASDHAEMGINLLIPVEIEAGENVIMAKVFSNEGPPRLRMGLVLDESRDFQAAWARSWGFLRKLIYDKTGKDFETPVVRWDALLSRMTVGVEVHDILNGRSLFQMDNVRSGNLIRDGGKVPGEGIYKITYKSSKADAETFEEYFLVGVPRRTLISLRRAIAGLPWSDSEKINVEAQLTRAGILFTTANYKPGDRIWEEKALYTLGNLAEFINLKKASLPAVAQTAKSAPLSQQQAGDEIRAGSEARATSCADIFKGMTGLRLRGYASAIDNSKQFYRLYVPSHYKEGDKLPLLLIMPTPLSGDPKPFLNSFIVASQRHAAQIGEFAERHGFAVLWPGYRSTPDWWTYEFTHMDEAIKDVEKSYDIDKSRINVYGTCAGGAFAGRLVSIYPNRFASIVYDRAFFDWDASGGRDDSMDDWIRAINPSDRVLANKNIKILVLNDGTRTAQHGPMSESRKYLERAQARRSDIQSSLGQRRMGIGLWGSVFDFAAGCKNEHPDDAKVDIPAASGYAGPISEVFAAPFIVVQGTRTNPEEAECMIKAITNLQEQYRAQFYTTEFILKKDTEITEEDIATHSLVLVGNAGSNITWGKLASRYGGKIAPYDPVDEWLAYPTENAFTEVFKNPANKKNYLLLIGADKLGNLALVKDINPFTAWFDSYVLKKREGNEREYLTARRP